MFGVVVEYMGGAGSCLNRYLCKVFGVMVEYMGGGELIERVVM